MANLIYIFRYGKLTRWEGNDNGNDTDYGQDTCQTIWLARQIAYRYFICRFGRQVDENALYLNTEGSAGKMARMVILI